MTAKDELNDYIAKLGMHEAMQKELKQKTDNYVLHTAEKAAIELNSVDRSENPQYDHDVRLTIRRMLSEIKIIIKTGGK